MNKLSISIRCQGWNLSRLQRRRLTRRVRELTRFDWPMYINAGRLMKLYTPASSWLVAASFTWELDYPQANPYPSPYQILLRSLAFSLQKKPQNHRCTTLSAQSGAIAKSAQSSAPTSRVLLSRPNTRMELLPLTNYSSPLLRVSC